MNLASERSDEAMRSNDKATEKKYTKRSTSEIVAAETDALATAVEPEHYDCGPRDIFTLKYEVNDKGIGQLLLPPSLSLLLQSDRVSISPSAGGLFIRSI